MTQTNHAENVTKIQKMQALLERVVEAINNNNLQITAPSTQKAKKFATILSDIKTLLKEAKEE